MEKITKFCSVLGVIFLTVLRPSAIIFGLLIVINFVDYITGILKSISNGEKVCPSRAITGIVKKLNKLFYVIVALSADILISHTFASGTIITPISGAVIAWLCINELVSICSNISNNSSIDVPPQIVDFLNKFKDKSP